MLNNVWLPLEMAEGLQLVQITVAHTLAGASRLDDITPVLKEMPWLLIIFLTQFKVLVLYLQSLIGFK